MASARWSLFRIVRPCLGPDFALAERASARFRQVAITIFRKFEQANAARALAVFLDGDIEQRFQPRRIGQLIVVKPGEPLTASFGERTVAGHRDPAMLL